MILPHFSMQNLRGPVLPRKAAKPGNDYEEKDEEKDDDDVKDDGTNMI